MRNFIIALLLASAVSTTNAEEDNPRPCFDNLLAITGFEVEQRDPTEFVTYELCAGTTFEVGRLNNQLGQIVEGDQPLSVRGNTHVKCGESGSSNNNCTILGEFGSFGITMVSTFNFNNNDTWSPYDLGNVTFEGITIANFTGLGPGNIQFAVQVAARTGDITFKDCIFKDNQAEPLIYLSEIDFTIPPPGSRPPGSGRNLKSNGYPYDQANKWCYGPGCNVKLSDYSYEERKLQDINDAIALTNAAVPDEDKLIITFDSCNFEDNQPSQSENFLPQSASLIWVQRTDPIFYYSLLANEKIKLQFINCDFLGNSFDMAPEREGENSFGSIISFNSVGELVMENNCFFDTTSKQYGLVTVPPTATVTNRNNFLDDSQDDGQLQCSFISELSDFYVKPPQQRPFGYKMPTYTFVGCGSEATAATCGGGITDPPTEETPADPVPALCFSADATCTVEGLGNVPMKNIKLGDKVLVDGNNNYETVYSFGHRNPTSKANFLRISTASHQLELTSDHLLFLEEGRSIPASHVKVGDSLQLAKNGKEQVINIESIKKQGVYAPYTPSGTIVVNGVKASTFAVIQGSNTLILSGVDTRITYQFIAHTFEIPHRLWCRFVSDCLEEQYTTEGINTWIALPREFARWLFKQNDLVRTIITLPILLLFGIFGNIQSLSLLLTISYVTWRFRSIFSVHVKSA